MRGVVLGAVVLLLVADGPGRGDRVRLEAAYGQIPAMESEAAYRAFLAAVKADNREAIRTAYRKSFRLVKSGTEAEVVTAAEGEIPAFPSQVPPIVVRLDGRDAWVPAVYAHPGRDVYPAEARFPVLTRALRPQFTPGQGTEMLLYSQDGRDIPVAIDYRSYRAMEKAIGGKDEIGMDQLVESKTVVMAAPESRVLVVKNHSGDMPLGTAASEIRFIDGQLKGRAFWVMFHHLAAPDLIVTTRREMTRKKR